MRKLLTRSAIALVLAASAGLGTNAALAASNVPASKVASTTFSLHPSVA